MSGQGTADPVLARITHLGDLLMELETILQSVVLNDSMIIDALAQLLGGQQTMQTRSDHALAALTSELRDIRTDLAQLHHAGSPAPLRLAPAAGLTDPECALLAYLQPFLSNRVAIDVGANVGEVAAALVEAGFEIYAFEPFAQSFAVLAQKAAAQQLLHVWPYALGAVDGEAALLLAADSSSGQGWDTSLFHSLVAHPMLQDLQFGASQPVPLRAIDSLIREGLLPPDAAVLKIDTEGHDLEVIRGAETLDAEILMSEFWDEKHPFGIAGHGNLAALVTEMRRRGYYSHIVMFRVDPTGQHGFYCNSRATITQSWGNVLFFRDHALFGRAVAWCDARLPRAA